MTVDQVAKIGFNENDPINETKTFIVESLIKPVPPPPNILPLVAIIGLILFLGLATS